MAPLPHFKCLPLCFYEVSEQIHLMLKGIPNYCNHISLSGLHFRAKLSAKVRHVAALSNDRCMQYTASTVYRIQNILLLQYTAMSHLSMFPSCVHLLAANGGVKKMQDILIFRQGVKFSRCFGTGREEGINCVVAIQVAIVKFPFHLFS